MPRIFDWECTCCGEVSKDRVFALAYPAPVPAREVAPCDNCMLDTYHRRLPPKFAEYLGEKTRRICNPQVSGGSFDTMGMAREPKMPSIPGWEEHNKKMQERVKTLPPEASREDVLAATDDLKRQGPRYKDLKDHIHSKEYKEARAEKDNIRRQNLAKRKRAKAIARGETTMRDSPLPGDPKVLKQRSS